MKTSEMIQSKFIRKEELRQTGPVVLTIMDCAWEDFARGGRDDRSEGKWVLLFQDHPKKLSLNTTKIRLLEAAYGDDSDYWRGKKVRLSWDPSVIMAGQVVGGIKLECSQTRVQAAPAPLQGYQQGLPPGQAPIAAPVASPAAPPGWALVNGQWVQTTAPAAPAVSAPAGAAPPQGGIAGLHASDEFFNDDIPF